MQQQESKRFFFEWYLSEFRDERDVLEPGSSHNSTCGAKDSRWRAQGGGRATVALLAPGHFLLLYFGVVSSLMIKNTLGIFLDFSENIFCVNFSKTQK